MLPCVTRPVTIRLDLGICAMQVVVELARGERWCVACGETASLSERECQRCDGQVLVDAVTILRPNEYRVQ